jgi:PKD repeat protein
MTMVETMLAVMLSSLMVLPMMGWVGLALQQQREVAERNISGASLGTLRTYFVRDVSTATAAWVEGDELSQCSSGAKGERTLLMLASGEGRTAYALVPDDEGAATLRRVRCAASGAVAWNTTDLAGDVIDGGTFANCNTMSDLVDAATALGLEKDAARPTKKDAAAAASDPANAGCRRVTLQLTTSQLDQVALTATLRAGSTSGIPAAEAPVAVIAATPTSGPRRLGVQFNGKESTDPAGEALTYSWDFGDGGSSTEAAPLHSYSSIGTFTATLTVTNESGLAASTEVRITVSDNVPIAVIASPATGTSVSRGQQVTFSSAGSNDNLDAEFGGRIVGYAWDFGDGTTSTEAAPTKTYAGISPSAGYTVRLTVFDDAGQTAPTEIKVIVANRLPTVTIVANTTSGIAPLTVDFSSIVVDETTLSPNPALTYAWDFGDGGTSTLADPPPRTYTTTGTRSVTLAVTDDQGATASASRTITVNSALLSPPTGLRKRTSGTTSGKRYIDLQFNSVTGSAGYEVMITCVSSGCSDVWSNTGSSTTIRISGLQNKSLSYDAQVRTKNSTGQWGSWSAKVRVSA